MAVRSIVEAIRFNSWFTSLTIALNNSEFKPGNGETIAMAVADVLRENNAITKLSLTGMTAKVEKSGGG